MNRVWVILLAATAWGTAAAATPASMETASKWNDRGLEAEERGDHAEAEAAYKQAIELWKTLGPDYDAHLATTQMNLGQTYCATGKRKEGATEFEQALARLRRTVGQRHERTITTMNLLGSVYMMLGDYRRAELLFREALPLVRELYPKDAQMARTLEGLATIDVNAGNIAEAQKFAEEALTIAIASEGEISLDAALAYAVTAEVHRIAGRPGRALPLYRKSRFIYEKMLGAEHPRVASILSQEGIILMRDGKLGLAEQNMQRALEITRKHCPDCVYELWVGESNLGLLRTRQKRYVEADELLTHSLELQEKYMPQGWPDLVLTIQLLANVREKLNRFDDAARLHKRADTLHSYR